MSEPIKTTEPTKEDAARFVEYIRGYGVFDRSITPMLDPSVMRVLAWLKERANGQ